MLTKSDKVKLAKSQQATLDALVKAGPAGLLTMQGIACAGLGFVARTRELRDLGYLIKKERVADDRMVYRYTFLGYSASPQLTLFQAVA